MILITGATGFLGGYIRNMWLEKGHRVRAIARNTATRDLPTHPQLEWVDGDILDVESLVAACEGIDLVIHAAAMVSFSPLDHAFMQEVNRGGTANVVNACLDTDVSRLLHISSIAAIGKPAAGEAATEETPWQSQASMSMYERTKHAAEMEVYRGIAEGLDAVMINPGFVIGPTDEWRSSMELFEVIGNGMPFYQPGKVALVAADDVAAACYLLAYADITAGERYIAVAENWRTRDLMTQFAEVIGKTPPRIPLAPFVSLTAARLADTWSRITGRKLALNVESIRSGLSEDTYDGGKLAQLGLTYRTIEPVIKEIGAAWKVQHPD